MFIDDFVPVARNLLVANAWLISHGDEIARAAAAATIATQSFVLGPPRTRLEALVVPMAWTAAPDEAFVEIQGDLQTARLTAESTHLSLSASCLLAVDRPGRRGQERAARRAAEQSVRSFLERVGTELEQRSAVGDGGGNQADIS